MDRSPASLNPRYLTTAGLFCSLLVAGHAQVPDTLAKRTVHPVRTWVVAGGSGLAITGSLVALDQAWYSKYPQVPFHLFNDGGEWQGMDKAGHAFATYTVGRWGDALLGWCGTSRSARTWAGGTIGLAYLTAVEYMDGRSAEWGFSWWDMAANAGGSALFIGQQLGWHEQRVTLKYSAHLTSYAEQRPEVLGSGLSERILKDYNGCTFWASVNLHAFGARKLPPWLNVAAGYGAEGMLHAEGDPGQFKQFFLAPDIALTRIPVKSKVWRTVLFALDCIKVPLPTLEFRSDGRVVGHGLYF